MSLNKGGAPCKTYNLKLQTPQEEELFNTFKKVGTFFGHTPRELFITGMRDFIDEVKPSIKGLKLVTETELLVALDKQGLKTNKPLLTKHRAQGNLDGMWWANTDGRLVYNLSPVLKFFKGRQGRGSGTWLNRTSNGSRKRATDQRG